MALQFGAIADDLTGGVELASMLVARGMKASLSIGPDGEPPKDSDAHVIALKSRVDEPRAAVEAVLAAARALAAVHCRQYFFKYCATFDSTPTGNIGPCAEALLHWLGAKQTVFVPTFSEVGRTVYQGHMFAGSQLLSESPKRFDPLTPMTDSNLCRVLAAQSRLAVGLLPHEVVREGPPAIRQHLGGLEDTGIAFVIGDAIYEDDVRAIASACAEMPLLTGNSSLAAHLVAVCMAQRSPDRLPFRAEVPGVDGRAAVLAGSCADRTAEQLAEFERHHPVLRIDLDAVFAGQDALAQAHAFLHEHAGTQPIAITTAAPSESVRHLQSKHGQAAISALAESILARIAVLLVKDHDVSRLLIAGGETAGAVLRALGVKQVDVAPYTGPGIGRVYSAAPRSIAMVLKSGKLGAIDMLRPSLESLRHPLRAPTEPRCR